MVSLCYSSELSAKVVDSTGNPEEPDRDLVFRLICPINNGMDPLNSAAAKLDLQGHRLIRYYTNVGMPISVSWRSMGSKIARAADGLSSVNTKLHHRRATHAEHSCQSAREC
jgi:hypothetical protein